MSKPVLYISGENPEIAEYLSAAEREIAGKCLKGEKIRNILYFLYSENVVIDEPLKKQLEKCFFNPSGKNLTEITKKKNQILNKLRRKKRKSKEKILISTKQRENSLKINYDMGVLYIS